ncbi:MAG: Sir2 family NAD-dependent protein deacetylase [Polyangiaceae bacterium]
MDPNRRRFDEAREAIDGADALIVTAGAGMGVDSGLPDFRGDEGFWRAYPPMKHLGLSFVDMANPRLFATDPRFAWGFYGHRLGLYRRTAPHAGFSILRAWAEGKRAGAFVFTSNVDGAFQRAGFDPERVVECHGAIDFLQCVKPCSNDIFGADGFEPDIDESTFRARGELPTCPRCGALARPNILMFGDGTWLPQRTDEQERRFSAFCRDLERTRAKVVVVECGAGTAIPTVRSTSEAVARELSGTLVRINLREPMVRDARVRALTFALGARAALEEIASPGT